MNRETPSFVLLLLFSLNAVKMFAEKQSSDGI